jgi:hypothetical protein
MKFFYFYRFYRNAGYPVRRAFRRALEMYR